VGIEAPRPHTVCQCFYTLTRVIAVTDWVATRVRLMEEWLELLAAGKISPVRPIKEFSVTDVEQAFRYMSAGTHMGKIVITGSPDPAMAELVKVLTPLIFQCNKKQTQLTKLYAPDRSAKALLLRTLTQDRHI